MWQTIQSFVEDAGANSTEDALFQQLEAAAADLGYAYWAFGALWGDPEAIARHQPPAVRLNYPEAWVQHYFASGYDKIDPVVMIAPYAQTSITWAELRHYRPAFFDEAASFGLIDGIAIPLRTLQGTYVLCVSTDHPKTITDKERARLEVFAYGFFCAYQRIRQLTPPEHGLTQNTIDVIRLSMAGLPSEEIAGRLGITTHGVYWCIKDAKKRLKCSNQAQLYLKAIQLGIVAV